MARLDQWHDWQGDCGDLTLGVEEEVMLVDAIDWSLSQQTDTVVPLLSEGLKRSTSTETHGSTLELRTGVCCSVSEAARELHRLRTRLRLELGPMGLRAASAGIHPTTVWSETVITEGERYQFVYDSMRELARREPTLGMHVHVGVADPHAAIHLCNRLRVHLPLLLALSANSPFWQGRDTGLSSARTPLFQAFPRVGIPRRFASYGDYVGAVDTLIQCRALPDPTFLWWDVRPQPRFGTVEVRIMDAQITADETAALVALIQCIAWLELYEHDESDLPPEVLDENRFIAARDGMHASLADPASGRCVPAREQLSDLMERCIPVAIALGCSRELSWIEQLAARTGAECQLAVAATQDDLTGLVASLSEAFDSGLGETGMSRLHLPLAV